MKTKIVFGVVAILAVVTALQFGSGEDAENSLSASDGVGVTQPGSSVLLESKQSSPGAAAAEPTSPNPFGGIVPQASERPSPPPAQQAPPVEAETPAGSSVCSGTPFFSDSFDGNAVDSNKWTPGLYWKDGSGGDGPLLNSTGSEVGTYVKDLTDARVFEQSQGTLKIRSTKEGGKFYTGALTAMGTSKPAFSEGCYEARMKFPNAGKGTWPAFWLISNRGGPSASQRPEIDIIEHVSSEPNTAQFAAHQLGAAPNFAAISEFDSYNVDVTQFHTYGIKWTAGGVQWYLDGKLAASTKDTTSEAMYLQLNLAMGGGWAGYPEDSLWANGKPTLEVDWITVTK